MRDDPRIRHAYAEGVLTLLDIARIYARGRDPNADLARCRVGSGISPTASASFAGPCFLYHAALIWKASLLWVFPQVSQFPFVTIPSG